MTHTTSQVSQRFRPFGTTIFAEMTKLALEHDAINLAQGFPDFDGPEFVKREAVRAIEAGDNQYARSPGQPALAEAIASYFERLSGRAVDPVSQVTVTSGCTEALASTFLGLIDSGDEVILFEPYYDSYRAGVSMAGGVARFVPLTPGEDGRFGFDEDQLRAAFTDRTKAIVVNTPHNPTGKVFTRDELSLIAELCKRHDVIAITDEVYERLTFSPDLPHHRLATFDGMWDRTLTLSSLGKSFSLTGWKIGWAIGPEHLTAGVRSAHQFLTFASATPLQAGAAAALQADDEYIDALWADYNAKRTYLCEALEEIGFRVHRPEGTYFIMADHSPFGFEDDVAFCRHLTEHVRVAAIPPSVFYANPEHGRSLVRFAFCKEMATLEESVRRMRALRQ